MDQPDESRHSLRGQGGGPGSLSRFPFLTRRKGKSPAGRIVSVAVVAAVLVLAATLVTFRSGTRKENASGRWVSSKEYAPLMESLRSGLHPGQKLIYFSTHSFFEDMLFQGKKRNLQIGWVVPHKGEVSREKAEDLRRYFERKIPEGIPREGMVALSVDNGVIRGEINGVRLEIIPYHRYDVMEQLNNGPVVFADSSIPYYQYENEVSTPMIRGILAYSAMLWNHLGNGCDVYFLANDGELPPKYRYFSRYIQEIVSNPQMINNEIQEKWWLRANAEYLESFFQYDDALENYLKASSLMPDDPALLYQVAFLQAKLGRNGYVDTLNRAYAMDNTFFDGFLEISIALAKSRRSGEAISLLRHAMKVAPSDPRPGRLISELEGSTR
jgi:hypothetical protein